MMVAAACEEDGVDAQPAVDVDLAIEQEQHAHRVRMAMLNDHEFMAGVQRGIEDERAGRLLSFDEFKRALDLD
jgi:hypothetical protein